MNSENGLFDHDDADGVWVLSSGSYSAYGVEYAFRNKATAQAFDETLSSRVTGDDEQVEFIPYIGSDVHVVPITTIARGVISIKWNGNKWEEPVEVADYGAVVSDEDPEPRTHWSVHSSETGDKPWETKPIGACGVVRTAYETSYTLGVTVTIEGTDIERVRKVYTEQRAQLVADPVPAVVAAWAEHGTVPPWVWSRSENQPILDALRQAGVK